jgi:uncharacterized protein YjdB
MIAGVGVVAAIAVGAWFMLGRQGAGSGEQGAGDSAAVTPAAPAPPAPVATVRVSPSPASITVGGTVQLAAALADAQGNALAGRAVTWQASDTSIVRVDPNGLVTARAAGSVTVTATSEGRSATATVSVTETVVAVAAVVVTPSQAAVALGDSLNLVAAPQDARGTTLGGRVIEWSSSASQVASVTEGGIVIARREGTATVTATSEGRRGTVRVTVTPPGVATVRVTPPEVTLADGARSQLSATAQDRRGATLSGRTVTWTSSDEDVAAVSSAGRVIATGPGRATITARIGDVTGRATVVVPAPAPAAPAPVAALAVSPASLTSAAPRARGDRARRAGRTLDRRSRGPPVTRPW